MNDTVCLCHINTLPHLEINPETKKGAGFFSERLLSITGDLGPLYTKKQRAAAPISEIQHFFDRFVNSALNGSPPDLKNVGNPILTLLQHIIILYHLVFFLA